MDEIIKKPGTALIVATLGTIGAVAYTAKVGNDCRKEIEETNIRMKSCIKRVDEVSQATQTMERGVRLELERLRKQNEQMRKEINIHTKVLLALLGLKDQSRTQVLEDDEEDDDEA